MRFYYIYYTPILYYSLSYTIAYLVSTLLNWYNYLCRCNQILFE